MRILLDTQAWLWWLVSPDRLAPEALALMRDGANELYFSEASAWEIAIKHALGKLPLPEPPETFAPARLQRDSITPLRVEAAHALRVAALPAVHRDAFDRLLVAQCVLEKLPILAADHVFALYGIEVVSALGGGAPRSPR